jgi:hypothetical protein
MIKKLGRRSMLRVAVALAAVLLTASRGNADILSTLRENIISHGWTRMDADRKSHGLAGNPAAHTHMVELGR